MTTDLVVQPLSAIDVRSQVNLIQEVMASVMKDGTHFGKIPGAGDKPTLFKAGAEKLASTFRLAVEPIVEELSHGDEYRVRIIARITEMGSERFLGSGVGECSSNESKYMWRATVCDEEYDQTPDNQRRVKWNKGYQKPAWSQKQVRMNVADVANTVLKMAKKRAMVDGILTVTGASDIFTQDIEELPKEYLDQKMTPASVTPSTMPGVHIPQPSDPQPSVISHSSDEPDIRPRSQKQAQPPTAPPAARPEPTQAQGEVLNAEPVISQAQGKRFFAISKSAGLSDEQVKAALASIGYHGHRDEIPRSKYNAAVDAIDSEMRFHTNK
jgi:hypothetical protein